MMADSLARLSFTCNSAVDFDSSNFNSFSNDLAKIACLDWVGGVM